MDIHGAGGVDQFSEAAAFDELHCDITDFAGFAGLVNLHDVRMLEGGGGAGLGDKSLGVRIDLAGAIVKRDDFERNVALQGGVFGAKDPAHGSLPDQRLQAKSADALAEPFWGGLLGI